MPSMSEPSAITGLPLPQVAVQAVGMPAIPRFTVKPFRSRMDVRYFDVSTSWNPSSPKLKTESTMTWICLAMPSTASDAWVFSIAVLAAESCGAGAARREPCAAAVVAAASITQQRTTERRRLMGRPPRDTERLAKRETCRQRYAVSGSDFINPALLSPELRRLRLSFPSIARCPQAEAPLEWAPAAIALCREGDRNGCETHP